MKETYKDKDVTLKGLDGNEITDLNTSLGTGMQIIIDDKTYEIMKYGDINGDGIIDARDSLRILKYVVEEYKLDEKVYFSAADINGDNIVDARDSLRILKYNVGEYEISMK